MAASASALASRIWSSSGQPRCCHSCLSARVVSFSSFLHPRQQRQYGSPRGMRCGFGPSYTHRSGAVADAPPHCARTTRFYRGGCGRNELCSSWQMTVHRGSNARVNEAWTPVRTMASSKTKEQPRGSLWRTRSVISKETVQAVHDLKRSKDDPAELARVFRTRIPRMLKMDLLATLAELQRQNEIDLALQVFDVVRKEIWYKPDQFLYRQMLDALGRNRRTQELEKKFQELQDEGITPEVPIYRELVGAYVRAHMLPQALEIHAVMVEKGFGDDRLSLQFIATGREKEAVRIKQRAKAAEKLNAEQEGALGESPSAAEV